MRGWCSYVWGQGQNDDPGCWVTLHTPDLKTPLLYVQILIGKTTWLDLTIWAFLSNNKRRRICCWLDQVISYIDSILWIHAVVQPFPCISWWFYAVDLFWRDFFASFVSISVFGRWWYLVSAADVMLMNPTDMAETTLLRLRAEEHQGRRFIRPSFA